LKTLFLAWQDPHSRTWFPIGKLIQEHKVYQFNYLQGALKARDKAGFEPIVSFPQFDHCYRSSDLFPLFANRLLRPSRPEFKDFVQWLNLPEQADNPIVLLARSGGKRKTDNFEVFPSPERDAAGNYHIHFFTHGLRYFPLEDQQYVQTLQPGTPLLLTHDIQNPVDSRALVLRTEDHHQAGYCPQYLTQDFFELVCKFPERVKVTIERVNPPPTPLQFRLLCNLTATWTDDFEPFSSPIYQVIPLGVAETTSPTV
jgi:hypothetical protein